MLGNRRGRLRIATPQNGSDPRFERGSWFDSRGRKNDATESVKTLVNSAVKGLSTFRRNEVLHALDRYLATHQSGPTRSLQGVVAALKEAQAQQSLAAPQPAPATRGAAAAGAAGLSDRKMAFEQWAAVNIEGGMNTTLKMAGFPQPSEALCRAAMQYAQAFMTKAIPENVAGTHDSAALHRLFGKEWKKSENLVFAAFRAIKKDAVASKIDPEIAMERATWQLRANEVTDWQLRANELTDSFQAMRQPSTGNNGAREKLHAEFNKIAADFARAPFDDATRKAWLEQSAKARGLSSEAHAALMATHKVSVILASDSVKALNGPQFETHLALVLARELVDDRGEIAQHDDIRRLRDALELGLAARPAVRDRLMDSLDRLSGDKELVSTLESINAPDSKNWAGQEMVRITLGLPSNAVLGRVEARVAALSALLAPLRQGSVGSCFATSQAIRLHDARPAEMLSDLKRLIEQGHLEFNVRGTTGPVKVPLSLLAGERDLDTTVLKVAHGPAGPSLATALGEDPRLAAALQAIGVDARDLAIRDALTGLTAASKQAQQAGEPAIKITPRALLEQIVFARANISYELRQKASQLPAKQEAYQRAAAAIPDADLVQLDKLGEARELMALDKELKDKIPRRESVGGYARYLEVQAEVARAISGYQSATDNRLLRAWEYTLSAAVEGKGSNELLGSLQAESAQEVKGLIDASGGRTMREGKLLLDEFNTMLFERLSYQYDASFERQATAADGSSTQGAFVLHDRSGSDDPQRWRRIDSEVELRRLLGGLMSEAALTLMNATPDIGLAAKRHLKDLERSLSKRLQTDPLPRLVDQGGTRGCWRKEQGYNSTHLMAARANLSVADVGVTRLRSAEEALAGLVGTLSRQTEYAASHQEVGTFLIGRLKEMARAQDVQAAIEADRRNFSLMVSTQSHAFLLKPGLKLGGKDAPSMLDAATSKLTPDAWWNEKVVEPANKIAKAGLDPQQLSETTRALREVVNRTRDPSGLTVQDLPWPAEGDSGYARWEGDLITLAQELSAASSGNAGGAGAAAPGAVVEVTLPALRGAFERKLEEALRNRDVRNVLRPSSNAEQKSLDEAIRDANEPVLERFMSLIDQEAARRHPPPPLVFADTNYRESDGSQAIGFAFIRNPANARDELWEVDIHDGRLLNREDDEQWRKGWKIYDNPALYLS